MLYARLEASENTSAKLQTELAQRREELDKIQTLETKIGTELEELKKKTTWYQDEMASTLVDVEGMKQQNISNLDSLNKEKEEVTVQDDNLRRQVNYLEINHAGKQQQLQDNPHHANLEAIETRMKQFEQGLFHLKSFIKTKTAESDYSKLKENCGDLAEKINQLIQKQFVTANQLQVGTYMPTAYN